MKAPNKTICDVTFIIMFVRDVCSNVCERSTAHLFVIYEPHGPVFVRGLRGPVCERLIMSTAWLLGTSSALFSLINTAP